MQYNESNHSNRFNSYHQFIYAPPPFDSNKNTTVLLLCLFDFILVSYQKENKNCLLITFPFFPQKQKRSPFIVLSLFLNRASGTCRIVAPVVLRVELQPRRAAHLVRDAVETLLELDATGRAREVNRLGRIVIARTARIHAGDRFLVLYHHLTIVIIGILVVRWPLHR